MPIVSVIVPFYKVYSFIGRCAQSLLSQSLEDVQFIFVNDATPDHSEDVLKDVIAKFPGRDVTILHHEHNKGLPAARNTGMAAARGKYIYHCDSDDWVESTLLERMVGAAEKNDADFVYCDFFLSFESSERYMVNPDYLSPMDALTKGFLSGAMKYNVWNKLVSKDLYKRTGILYPEGHSMGEDMTMILLLRHAHGVAHVKEGLYHYVKLNQNAFSQTFSQRHLADIRFNADRVFSYLDANSIPENEKYTALFKLNLKLPFLLSQDKSQYELWRQWYPEANSHVFDNPELPMRTKLVQWLASKNQFWAVGLYGWLINKIYYGLLYR